MMACKHILVSVCLLVAVFISTVASQCIDKDYDSDLTCDYKDKETFGNCSIRGDPHVRTWDGVKYRFDGDCSYTLVDYCDNEDTLQINAKFRRRIADPTQTVASAVMLIIEGTTYSLAEGGVTVVPGSDPLVLPYAKDSNNVEIFETSKYYILRVYGSNGDLIMRIEFCWKFHIILIHVRRDDFYEFLCGMCGYYNGKPSDDLKTKSNKVKTVDSDDKRRRRRRMTGSSSQSGTKVQKFGDKWEIEGSCP